MTAQKILIPMVAVACASWAFAEEAAKLEIAITKEGEVVVAGQVVVRKDLRRDLRAAVEKSEDAEVLITASEKAPLEVISEVLRVLREAGVQRFSLQSR